LLTAFYLFHFFDSFGILCFENLVLSGCRQSIIRRTRGAPIMWFASSSGFLPAEYSDSRQHIRGD